LTNANFDQFVTSLVLNHFSVMYYIYIQYKKHVRRGFALTRCARNSFTGTDDVTLLMFAIMSVCLPLKSHR